MKKKTRRKYKTANIIYAEERGKGEYTRVSMQGFYFLPFWFVKIFGCSNIANMVVLYISKQSLSTKNTLLPSPFSNCTITFCQIYE